MRADMQYSFKTFRKCLAVWKDRCSTKLVQRAKIMQMREQIFSRLKLDVLLEWKQYVLAR